MDEDKIFELAELLADEAFGDKGMIMYAERQELTSKFNEILVKNLTIPDVVGQSEQFTCKICGTHKKKWNVKNSDWYCKTCKHICR